MAKRQGKTGGKEKRSNTRSSDASGRVRRHRTKRGLKDPPLKDPRPVLRVVSRETEMYLVGDGDAVRNAYHYLGMNKDDSVLPFPQILERTPYGLGILITGCAGALAAKRRSLARMFTVQLDFRTIRDSKCAHQSGGLAEKEE